MSAPIRIYCRNLDRYIDIEGGDTLLDILRRIPGQIPFEPINARVNNKSEDLHFAVYSPKTVEFMPIESPSGLRTYIRSLCMMLYHAVDSCLPGCRLKIEHSLSHGYFCRITGPGADNTPATASRLKDAIRSLVGRNLPFERREERTTDVIDIFRRQGLNDKVLLLETLHDLYTVYYRLDGLCDSYYGALAPSTGMLGVFDLIPYEDGFLLLGPDDADPALVARPVSQQKM